MAREVIKEHERKLLIKRLFPTPLAGYEHTLVLFQTCRELGDQYCLSFDEKGYTADYKPFDSEEVIEKAVKLLTDDRLPSYVEKYKDKLQRSDFRGKYYTYDQKTKSLKLKSEWEKIEAKLNEFFQEHGNNGKAVLRAIWEANVNLDKKWNNYYIIYALAKKYGLKKGYRSILDNLRIFPRMHEPIRYIKSNRGVDIQIPDELIPLIENVLQGLDLIL